MNKNDKIKLKINSIWKIIIQFVNLQKTFKIKVDQYTHFHKNLKLCKNF